MAMRESIDITEEEKNQIQGIKYNETGYFNPVLDINDVWQISKDCVDMITKKEFLYLKDRESHEYTPKPVYDPFLEETEAKD